MLLNFTNKQIYFVLESIWNNSQLDYRFKTHINGLVTTNDGDDFVQSVTVNVPTLMLCYQAMSSGQYGCTTDMAEVLLNSLRDQLIANSNMTEYMTYTEVVKTNPETPEIVPNEYTQALLMIMKYKEQDVATAQAKIVNGKAQILS